MERIVLFLVLGAFLTGSMYTLNVESNTRDADDALQRYQYKELARDAALAGLRRTVASLARNAHTPWSGHASYDLGRTPYGDGAYEVDVQTVAGQADTVDVYVLGIFGPDSIRIDARYERAQDLGGVPPAFRSVILTEDLLQVRGNITITTLDPGLNANIHTNDELRTNGNSFIVEGYGTYANASSTSQPDNFQPRVDYNGPESNVLQVPEITLPDARLDSNDADVHWVDTDNWPDLVLEPDPGFPTAVLNIQDEIYGPGGFCTDGRIPPSVCWQDGNPVLGDTQAFVWWVAGNIDMTNVQVQGNVVLYADGYRTINGTPDAAPGAGLLLEDDIAGEINADDQTQLMLRTAGEAHIRGNDRVIGSIWANGDVTFYGTPDFYGNVLTPEARFEGLGDFTLTYAAPSTLITTPGYRNDDPIGPVLIGYAEWDEEYLP